MEYRQLGNSGVRVSVIGLGTNRFGSASLPQEGVNRMIDAALDLGINFIDTANGYQDGRSEETLGQALKERRDRFVLATKFYFPVGDGPNDQGASRYHMLNAAEASLRRLQSDHIDLYYVHRWDENTPIEETLRALDDLIRQGKVRYVGASNFASWQLAHANLLAEVRGWTPFVVLQSHYHMLERSVEREVLPYCRAHNVGFVPYFPLAGGFLTGKYKRGQAAPAGSRGESNSYVQQYMTKANYDKIEQLTTWAEAHKRGLNELAQAWLLAQPQVCSVISGATKLEQVLSNVKAADWTLTSEELAEVNAILDQ
jgi:aryl-alcohol dehydrogenase-like predicted oxidoreductase